MGSVLGAQMMTAILAKLQNSSFVKEMYCKIKGMPIRASIIYALQAGVLRIIRYI